MGCPLRTGIALHEKVVLYRKVDAMHLMYFTDASGKRQYTLKKEDGAGIPSVSAHPARFSPDDKFSKERITTKKRFGLLPTQVEGKQY